MKKKYFILILIILSITNLIAIDYDNVELIKLTDKIWLHITYFDFNGYKTPSNGLIVDANEGLVLIDTPWTNKQTENLIKLTKEKFKKNIILALFTHYHQDRIGGIEVLHKNNINTMSTELTAKFALKSGYQNPKKRLNSDITQFNFKNIKFETFFPGAGHSLDNIVVWFPEDKILFGGCLIKSEESTNIGNITEGDLNQYPLSLEKLAKRYTDIKLFIPGHGSTGKSNLIKHTLDLIGNK